MSRRRFRWAPYVPVAQRREEAQEKIRAMKKQGKKVQPIEITGRSIAYSFWGKAWCDHIQSFSDYSNRLPRGRSYVKNGAVVHLEIRKGEIFAKVAGTRLYTVLISIKTLPPKKWKEVKKRCSGQIGSMIELLQGKMSENVMTVVTDRQNGLFPLAKEISLDCTCPDWAVMCKHVAAVMYGVGARLDENPELLFLLRGVDHMELIDAQAKLVGGAGKQRSGRKRIAQDDLTDVFGIEVSEDIKPAQPRKIRRPRPTVRIKRALPPKTGPTNIVEKGPTRNKKHSTLHEARREKKRDAIGKNKKAKTAPAGRPTGKEVASCRKKLKMSMKELAVIMHVSWTTIRGWEQKTEPIAMHKKNLESWNIVKELSREEARKKLFRDYKASIQID
ncbi:zinc finger SWIM domain protein [Desulfatibacillum aliphaticivorans]|uniref:Zinc finger SWIM domain protein n=1 Tax=Desulfatibacillum aliphaticivorans TaxID=218208 RepID=B8FL85_DESAL|nr:SWIM zinc finger family protein [Desulfatibacillum aliphaticivorans]ACL04720.1 zinc finger SWIM domain protein [Desulfatibacillum aliphaticivorans]